MTHVLGLIVNPKLKRPVLVTADSHVNIHILDQDGWPEMGSGYYDTDSSDPAVRVTGMPRSHTPDGVMVEGQGYGTALYTALCLGAHQNAENHEGNSSRYRIERYGADGDGICSVPGGRSESAEEWWDMAKTLRLAVQQEDDDTQENVDVTSEFSDSIDGREYGEGTISHVNTIDVDVTTVAVADAYPWQRALRNNLLIADFHVELEGRAPESLYRILMSDDDIEVNVEVPWILALDVRGLTLEAINLLGVLAQTAGASEEDLRMLRYRWEAGLDPGTDVRQLALQFRPNSAEGMAMREVQELREAAGWANLELLP